jgi:hypothetical protein
MSYYELKIHENLIHLISYHFVTILNDLAHKLILHLQRHHFQIIYDQHICEFMYPEALM